MNIPGKCYQRRVDNALNGVIKNVDPPIRLDLQSDRWVIFSDHHKGVRDRADDFRDSENPYHAALGYYFELGYKLVVLGDAEELWENRPRPVLQTYRSTMNLEREFHDLKGSKRYWKIWGNHDDEWRFVGRVNTHLADDFDDIEVHEGLILSVQQENNEIGRVFLVHGHQGTIDSDVFGWFSRYPVRYFWRPIQRLFRIRTNTPASDWSLKQKHNIALYNWAVDQGRLILIAGHTHRPVFFTGYRLVHAESKLNKARALGNAADIAIARAELEYVKVRESRWGFPMTQPCYFNTGCCCFDDGDITGIEIVDGSIRLVRWPDDAGNPKPKILAESELTKVFNDLDVPGARISELY